MTDDQAGGSDGDRTTEDAAAADTQNILKIDEPLSATRLSPYAIAALAVSVVGLWVTSQSFLFSPPFFYPPFAGDLWRQLVFELLPLALPPIVVLGLTFFLAGRAEVEVLNADGGLGGVGLYRAARVVSVGVVAIFLVGAILKVVGPDFPDEPPVPALPAEPFEEDLDFVPPGEGGPP